MRPQLMRKVGLPRHHLLEPRLMPRILVYLGSRVREKERRLSCEMGLVVQGLGLMGEVLDDREEFGGRLFPPKINREGWISQ